MTRHETECHTRASAFSTRLFAFLEDCIISCLTLDAFIWTPRPAVATVAGRRREMATGVQLSGTWRTPKVPGI